MTPDFPGSIRQIINDMLNLLVFQYFCEDRRRQQVAVLNDLIDGIDDLPFGFFRSRLAVGDFVNTSLNVFGKSLPD